MTTRQDDKEVNIALGALALFILIFFADFLLAGVTAI